MPISLDDLVVAIRDVMNRRFPKAEWAALTIHQPGLPDAILPVILTAQEPETALGLPVRRS